jgi:hypothetical protein
LLIVDLTAKLQIIGEKAKIFFALFIEKNAFVYRINSTQAMKLRCLSGEFRLLIGGESRQFILEIKTLIKHLGNNISVNYRD